jgi:phage/plasmid-like protein (TIGR03299 family)
MEYGEGSHVVARPAGRIPFYAGVGKDVSRAEGFEQALGMAGLDFDIEQVPSEYRRRGELFVSPDRVVNLRSDNGGYLGTVGKVYQPIPNRDLGGPIEALIEQGLGKLDRMAGLRGGSVFMVAMSLGPEIVLDLPADPKGRKDVLQPKLVITSSHDGTRAERGTLIVERLVCVNGLTMPVAARQFTIRHTGDVIAKRAEADRIYARWFQYHELFIQRVEQLAHRKVSGKALDRFIQSLFPAKDEEQVPKPTQAKRDELKAILANTEDLQAIAGTAWGVYNAVVQFADHGIQYRSRGFNTAEENRALATLDGPGQWLKDKAFTLLASAN